MNVRELRKRGIGRERASLALGEAGKGSHSPYGNEPMAKRAAIVLKRSHEEQSKCHYIVCLFAFDAHPFSWHLIQFPLPFDYSTIPLIALIKQGNVENLSLTLNLSWRRAHSRFD